ncbi:MAG: hypothetical protein A2289_26315 [Deltaproteobacteria bacterium RIFOXYA12_FULL_58_15]|nr:MAG: hypothetical protein A2289_26315 [Deltaproteobacteria bacterium RIFOXYA12_FULL_58_15]OGR09572.1 MAG: hypothetical protein A2341_16405 [Deltaproteobacteria bacterium RIFOXYB12_FULL_58_9]
MGYLIYRVAILLWFVTWVSLGAPSLGWCGTPELSVPSLTLDETPPQYLSSSPTSDQVHLQLDAPIRSRPNPHERHWLAQTQQQESLLLANLDVDEGWLVATGRAVGFISGAWAAALTHEFGHGLVAWGHGYQFIWPTREERSELFLPMWTTKPHDMPASDRRNIGMAGFLMSAAVSETMMAFDFFPKSDAFVGGFIFYDLLNAMVYVFRDIYEMSRSSKTNVGIGDIRDMDRGGIPREAVYIFLLARSALVLGRILEDRDFLTLSYWFNSAKPY